MKTINVFGRKMPILAILMALLVIGTASAAVVDYLSNMEEAEVEVSSPFTVELSTDGVNWNDMGTPLLLRPENEVAYGGETSEFYVKYTNLADQDIDVEVNTEISCDVNGLGLDGEADTIGNEDFENDLLSAVNYENGVLNGIMVSYSINNDAFSTSMAINYEPLVFYNGDVLEIPIEGLNTLNDWPFVLPMFPADSNIVVHYVLHHAPNALGDYTITTIVNDPDFGEEV